MAKVILGTTPTFKFRFSIVDVSNITTAIMTVKQDGVVVIEKTLSDATADTKALYWTLSQAETLSLKTGLASVMLNWKTNDGTRGASLEEQLNLMPNHKKEVI